MTIQALIFDCDGTLVDSMNAHFTCWRDAVAPYGMELRKEDFFLHCGTPSSTVIPLLAKQQGATVEFKKALVHKEQLFLNSIELLKPIQPIVEIARQNRGQLKMAVASGGTRILVEQQLRHIQIIDWFETIVTCEDTERHKPDPDVFLEAASRLGVEPSACRVFEDGDPGIQAAHAAGMECIDIREMPF